MSARKPMTASGYTLPQELDEALTRFIREADGIQLADVVAKAWDLGAPRRGPTRNDCSPAYRIADRLLQRERRAGTIRFGGGKWHRATPPLAGFSSAKGR